MTLKHTFQTLPVLFVSLSLASCGAPLKTADQVKGIFSNSQQLKEKVSSLCTILGSRPASPNLNGIGLANEVCTNPGSRPLDYNSMQKSVGFSIAEGVAATSETTKTAIFRIQTRSEMWLNRNILALAQVMFNQLKSETDGLLGSSGGAGESANKDFQFKVIGKPTFDTEKWQLDLQFSISSSKAQNGQVDINNTFKVSGILFEQKYFAALAETVGSEPVEKSIMESGRFLIVLVPHAGDIYLDITSDIRLHSFGVDSVMKTAIIDALGPGLKSIPDLLSGLSKRNGQ